MSGKRRGFFNSNRPLKRARRSLSQMRLVITGDGYKALDALQLYLNLRALTDFPDEIIDLLLSWCSNVPVFDKVTDSERFGTDCVVVKKVWNGPSRNPIHLPLHMKSIHLDLSHVLVYEMISVFADLLRFGGQRLSIEESCAAMKVLYGRVAICLDAFHDVSQFGQDANGDMMRRNASFGGQKVDVRSRTGWMPWRFESQRNTLLDLMYTATTLLGMNWNAEHAYAHPIHLTLTGDGHWVQLFISGTEEADVWYGGTDESAWS